MKFLLDTNVLSEMRKPTPSKEVMNWISSIENEHLYISSITLGEISRGINKLPDGQKKNELIVWLDKIQNVFRYQTLSIDSEAAIKWGELSAAGLRAGKSVSTIDFLIGATAYTNGAILVTRNTKDFEDLPIQVLNPWL